ncbi:hypothetical protein N665_0712s0007 [Sinapis alba]|nr:hypothetical protein N665_0712s0007 [Sinapis alba]
MSRMFFQPDHKATRRNEEKEQAQPSTLARSTTRSNQYSPASLRGRRKSLGRKIYNKSETRSRFRRTTTKNNSTPDLKTTDLELDFSQIYFESLQKNMHNRNKKKNTIRADGGYGKPTPLA